MENLISISEHTAGAPIYIGNGNENILNINDEGLFDRINSASEIRTVIQDARCLTAIMENDVEIAGARIKFTDNLWDFSSLKDDLHYSNSIYKYDFSSISSDYYVTLLKLFVYNMIMDNGIAKLSNHGHFANARLFVKYLEEMHIQSLGFCSKEKIAQWIDIQKLRCKSNSISKKKTSIKLLFTFYYNVTNTSIDQDILDYLDELPDYKAQLEAGKLSLLPYAFMHALCDCLFHLFDEEQDSQKKREIGLLCIATQTGLRPIEFLNLETNCIEQTTIDGMPVAKLRYRATKQRRGKGFVPVYTVANSKVVHVVNDMRKYCAEEDTVFSAGMDEFTLNKALRKIVHDHAEDLGCITDEPDPQFNGKPEEIKTANGKTCYINYPVIKQFRVYLSSEYSRRGYDAYTIAKLLGHTDPKMLNYYERPAVNRIQEDPVYTNAVLHDIVENDLTLLGPKGDVYQKRIQKFVEKDKFNVRPIDTAINDIASEMPIRQIPGGLCITPSIKHPCELDNGLNADKLLCAYGLCSNQCHLYFHCAYHYNQFVTAKSVIKHNASAGFKQQTEKEFNKTQVILKTLLIPELQQLKAELEKQGSEAILQQHPEVQNIVSDFDAIWTEVNLWVNGTLKQLIH